LPAAVAMGVARAAQPMRQAMGHRWSAHRSPT
jgi:hypothetical protein